jgi:hypothetical protein
VDPRRAELHLGEDVVVPDLAGWRRERMRRLPDEPALTLAPDWVCEVISPSTARVDRAQKLPIYSREQVAWLWLVDPLARTLEIFRLQDDAWKLAAVKGPLGSLHIRHSKRWRSTWHAGGRAGTTRATKRRSRWPPKCNAPDESPRFRARLLKGRSASMVCRW